MEFIYDYKAVKTEAGFWITEPEKIKRIARDFCPEKVITLNIPIGDYFCQELTRSDSPYKGQFDILSIVLPRILGMTTDDTIIGKRFSEDYYNEVLSDSTSDDISDDTSELTQIRKTELAQIRKTLVLYLDEDPSHNNPETLQLEGRLLLKRLKKAHHVLVEGITSGNLGDRIHREIFWGRMSVVLLYLYGDKFSTWMRHDTNNIHETIAGRLPTMLPIGGYYIHLRHQINPRERLGTIPIDEVPNIYDIQNEVTTPEEAEIFKGLFSFLIDFFSGDGDGDTFGRAGRNARTRAPQNIFILLRRFCLDNPFLTEFDFRTGKSSTLISNATDFEKLKNQASQFLEQPVNADPKLFRDFLDPNPSNDGKQRGKTRAIYELLSWALDGKKDTSPTKAENTEKGRNLQLRNAMKWEVRDFKTILQKWLVSLDQETHNALYELYETEFEDHGPDKDGRLKNPLYRIFEPFESEQAEDCITRVGLGDDVKINDLAVFFYLTFSLYETD